MNVPAGPSGYPADLPGAGAAGVAAAAGRAGVPVIAVADRNLLNASAPR